MVKENTIKIFEDYKVRTIWDSELEEWYFSIVDVVALLTESNYQTARNYWKVLKNRLKKEGNESVTNCNQLKLISSYGKNYQNIYQRYMAKALLKAICINLSSFINSFPTFSTHRVENHKKNFSVCNTICPTI